jgi:hypothetical protein
MKGDEKCPKTFIKGDEPMLATVLIVSGMVLAVGYIFFSTAEDAPEDAFEDGFDGQDAA